jgi:hypothetical protein
MIDRRIGSGECRESIDDYALSPAMLDAVSGVERAVRRAFWIIYVDWDVAGSDVEDLSGMVQRVQPGQR